MLQRTIVRVPLLGHWGRRCTNSSQSVPLVADVVYRSKEQGIWRQAKKNEYLLKSTIEGYDVTARLNCAYPINPLYNLYFEDEFLFSCNSLQERGSNMRPTITNAVGTSLDHKQNSTTRLMRLKWKDLPGIWMGDDHFKANKEQYYINPADENDYTPFDLKGEANGITFYAMRSTTDKQPGYLGPSYSIYRSNSSELLLSTTQINNLAVSKDDGALRLRIVATQRKRRRLRWERAHLQQYTYKAKAFGRTLYASVNGDWPEMPMYTVGWVDEVTGRTEEVMEIDDIDGHVVWEYMFPHEYNQEIEALLFEHCGEFLCAGKHVETATVRNCQIRK